MALKIFDIKGFKIAKKYLLAESKTAKNKKAGPNDPALIEGNCDRLPEHHLPVQDFPAKNKTTLLNL